MIFRDTYSQNLSSWMKIVVSVHVSPSYIYFTDFSSLFLNLIAAQVVFSRTYNKTSHAGVLKMLRVNITWQNHKEREIKPKHNIKFSIMLKLKCSFKRLRQLGLQIWCLTKVRTRPAGRGDLGNFLIVLTKRPLLLPYISHRSRFFRLNSPSINENSLTENVL